jgi:hypothetical protein
MSVNDRDNGWSELERNVSKIAGDSHVLVGVQGAQAAAAHPSDDEAAAPITNADVATWNEFGTGQIPARSFLRATVDINQARLLALGGKLGAAILDGRIGGERSLELLGQETKSLIQRRITAHIPPENRPSTIAKKGSSTPLIDRGILRASITYVTRMPGGGA